MGQVRDAFGATGGAKYGYQAYRAAKGLGTTTRLTAGLDLASGSFGLSSAAQAGETLKSSSTLLKGAAGSAKISRFAKVASVAGKVGPFVAKGSAVLGVALGGFEIGSGIKSISDGKSDKGRDQIVSGTADVITSGALGVAAVSSGTVVGLPVAAVALGVAGVSQGAKYAWKYRENIGDAAKATGKAVSGAADWTGKKIGDAAEATGKAVSGAADWTVKKAGGAADWAGDQISDAAGGIKSAVSSGMSSLKDAFF